MDNERRYKTLSKILIAIGIIMSIGSIIAMICGKAGVWSIPVFDDYGWLWGLILGAFNILILGVLIGRKHRWDKIIANRVFVYKIAIAVGLIGHLATAFGNDVQLWENPDLTLNQLFIFWLGCYLCYGIVSLIFMRKGKSTD